MASVECVVCAWRVSCNLKFRYESTQLHCPEFTRDVAFAAKDPDVKIEPSEPSGADDKEKDRAE
ncbi:MAG: hypothetical protein OEV92_04425 [Nitrospinota bacterium]|nr:hypothetical protein [Nitrospinota bacterium]